MNIEKEKSVLKKVLEKINERLQFKKSKTEIQEIKDNEERETWGSGIDFFLSALGYAG